MEKTLLQTFLNSLAPFEHQAFTYLPGNETVTCRQLQGLAQCSRYDDTPLHTNLNFNCKLLPSWTSTVT
jgi:hypothetical protein